MAQSKPGSSGPRRGGGGGNRNSGGRPSGSSRGDRSKRPGSRGDGGRPGGGGKGRRSDPDTDRGSGRPSGRKSGGAPRKYSGDKAKPSGRNYPDEPIPGNQNWGGLARKGALRATHDEIREYEEGHDDSYDLTEEELEKRAQRDERRAAREVRRDELLAEAKTAVERANSRQPKRKKPSKPRAKPARDRRPLPAHPGRAEDETSAITRLLGPVEAKKQLRKLRNAADAFEAERYEDAEKSLRPLSQLVPSVPEVRELFGLTLYRLGKFRAAARELEDFRVLGASADQNPVLADCYRAQQRWADVEELWAELAEASPSADAVNEGRIVMAGALADQGDMDAAVRLLEKGWKRPSRPYDHHLRRAYALADLYERSGNMPRARALFEWIASKDPEFVDTRARIRNLR